MTRSEINKTFKLFSQLTPKQKDAANKTVCELLAINFPSEYVQPKLWGIFIASDNYNQVQKTQLAAKKYTIGRCFNHLGQWIPLSVKDINKHQPNQN